MSLGGQFNIAHIVEQVLNRHRFDMGYANQLRFMSAFPDFVLQTPRGWKVMKFTKFAGEAGESTVEHVAGYQIECGDLANNEYL